MKLFYKPGACSLASHIALRESGLDFTLQGVDLVKRLENGDDYLLINPKGQVPALLLDDELLLTEGVAIMQYIADRVGPAAAGSGGHRCPLPDSGMAQLRCHRVAQRLHPAVSSGYAGGLQNDGTRAAGEEAAVY